MSIDILTSAVTSNWNNLVYTNFVLFSKVQHAIDSIKEMKSHLMRSKNQEEARTKLLDEMTESDVIITCDWAMKFLPRKFREGQTDWFGKRGINWHVAVTLSKRGGAFQTITHISGCTGFYSHCLLYMWCCQRCDDDQSSNRKYSCLHRQFWLLQEHLNISHIEERA